MLEADPLPPFLVVLWETFIALSRKRTHGMGTNPISSLEIESWCRLHQVELSPWEVEIIEALDAAVMDVWVTQKKQTESTK